MKFVYLDNSATTELAPSVRKSMINAMDVYGNPSSLHSSGVRAKKIIENARSSVSKLINCNPSEIFFTSGGTEGNNSIINSIYQIAKENSEKRELIVSSIEHPSILSAAKNAEKNGVKVSYIAVDSECRLDINAFKKALNVNTALVSVMLANNEIGTIQDIKMISELAHEAGALMHSDIVQAVGKIEVNVDALGLDYATLSAHKIYGPKGVGAIFFKKGSPFQPLLVGGHQESSKRAGTYNTIGIVGFGEAAKLAINTPQIFAKDIMPIRDELAKKITDQIQNIKINSVPDFSLPNVLNVSFAGAEGESILLALDYHGIQVSTGSACASGSGKPSHVLMAMKADPEIAHGSIRFSFGLENTSDDVDYLMKCLPDIIENLRQISTVGYGGRDE